MPLSSKTLAVIRDAPPWLRMPWGLAVTSTRVGRALPIAIVTDADPVPLPELPPSSPPPWAGPPETAVMVALPERESATKLTRATPSLV